MNDDWVKVRTHVGRIDSIRRSGLRFPDRANYGCVDCDSDNHTSGSMLCQVGPKVTDDPQVLIADKTNAIQWMPGRVADICHEVGVNGHVNGFCRACASVYEACNRVLGEIERTNKEMTS